MSNVIDMQEWLDRKQEETVKRIFGQDFWDVLITELSSTDTITYTYEDDTGETFTIKYDGSED
jgi:hypothetical protein